MKAAVLIDAKKIEYREDYPKPTPGPDDVIVKVHYCGVCGSDLTNFKYRLYQVPLIMGHEFSGEIVELGANVKDWKIGDKVVGINVALKVGETSGMGIFQDGGYAEFVKVPTKYLFAAPEFLSYKDAVFIETFANAFRAMKLCNVGKKEKIIVIGAGPIGLTLLQALIAEKEPEYIIVVELNEFLREQAVKIGATEAFPPSRVKINKFIKKNKRPTYIFDCAGTEATIKIAMDHVIKGGKIVLEGMHKGSIDFPIMTINTKEIKLIGVIGHDRDDILNSIQFFEEKKFDSSKFKTEIIHLNEVQRSLERFLEPEKREFVKMMIEL
jgi:L-iditol 2-dehydrogenase